MKLNQGDIYLANLDPTKGHEQSGYRPVLVMQNNFLNKNLNTVVVAPLTTNLQAKDKLTTYFLLANETKLKNDSVVLLFQIRTIDKDRLNKKVSSLKTNIFYEIKKQLNFIF